MHLNFIKKSNILIVGLIGELDHHTAAEVRAKIDDKIESENIKKLILDFSRVSFMDSSGIGVVVGRSKKLSHLGGSVCIANASGSVKKVFELSGLYKIIKNFDTVEKAVGEI